MADVFHVDSQRPTVNPIPSAVEPTAVELLKAYSFERSYGGVTTQRLVGQWATDKGFRFEDILEFNGLNLLAVPFTHYVLRTANPSGDALVAQYIFRTLIKDGLKRGVATYTGSRAQNARIDSALLSREKLFNGFPGIGAADFFQIQANIAAILRIQQTRIAIVGAGPSGSMVHSALRNLGFSNISVYDKTGHQGGIWTQENVTRSRNNPRVLNFQGQTLLAAPGGGVEVYNYVQNLSVAIVHRVNITRIVPGDLNHRVYFHEAGGKDKDSTYETFPIVINCCGLGKPRPLSDPQRMTTDTSKTLAGFRWQQNLKSHVNHERIVMFGLGNSTAEMLLQIQDLRDKGKDIDYRILTHYPYDAVQRPFETVPTIEKTPGGTGLQRFKHYRVWRDLTKPDLTSYAGDLPALRRAYMIALRENRIISDVQSWTIDKGSIYAVKGRGGDSRLVLPFTDLYTLIGYQMEPETYKAYGIHTLADGYAAVDYDGEFQRPDAQKLNHQNRVYAGYFGLGPTIETPENRNAVVIPGNIFRMGDLVMGVIFRAMQARGA